jgi:hypothetical protein
VAIGIIFAFHVCRNGIPALRHDWQWPVTREEFFLTMLNSVSGWVSTGFGQPQTYPSNYLVDLPLVVFAAITGPYGALIILSLFTGWAVAFAVFSLCDAFKASTLASVAAALFAAFNPWTYNEIVAGHILMVLSYGGLLFLVANIARGKSQTSMAWPLLLVFHQLQFFALALVALVTAIPWRRPWLAFLVAALLCVPIVIGMTAGSATLLATPYTLSWQATNSVAFPQAFLLLGYFTRYADVMGFAAHAAMWLIAGAAALALVSARRSRVAVPAACLLVVFALIASGTKGPLAALYGRVVLLTPFSGFFRELYDLVAVVAICYAVLLARANRFATAAALCASSVLTVLWFVHPPAAFWLNARALPRANVAADPQSRYALFPAFQPLSYRGKGSGVDPDARYQSNGAVPLNEYLASYPAAKALSFAQVSAGASGLEALGVSYVACRTDFATSRLALFADLSRRPPSSSLCNRHLDNPVPLASLVAYRIGNDPSELGGGEVFVGDVPGADAVIRLTSPRASDDPHVDWIDARLAFAANPEMAQGLGGVMTSSHRPLWISDAKAGDKILAFARGRVFDGDRALPLPQAKYAWAPLSHPREALRCEGTCLVAALGRFAELPLTTGRDTWSRVDVRYPLPWLAFARVPPGKASVLRFNVSYNTGWQAWAGTLRMPHVRLDTVTNGWMLPQRRMPQQVVVVHVPSLFQAATEFFALVMLPIIFLARRDRKRMSWV